MSPHQPSAEVLLPHGPGPSAEDINIGHVPDLLSPAVQSVIWLPLRDPAGARAQRRELDQGKQVNMHVSSFRKSLIAALSVLSLFGAVEVAAAACPPPKPPVCEPDFTGRSIGSSARCVFPPPTRCELRGPRGHRGEKGDRGKRGGRGKTGASGSQGVAGHQGSDGVSGATGAIGATGSTGATGVQGATGSTGATGGSGAQGIQGVAGAVGAVGAVGAAGAGGAQGAAGADGATGAAGAVGVDGPAGPPGPAGQTGQTGNQGPAGAQGATGQTGPPGLDAPAEYAEFFALMPPDNAATVGAGEPVDFPRMDPRRAR